MYAQKTVPDTAPEEVSALTVAARRDLYGDAINEALLMKPGRGPDQGSGLVRRQRASTAPASGLAALVGRTSDGLRRLQTGFARSYALSMLAGAALVVAVILAVQLW